MSDREVTLRQSTCAALLLYVEMAKRCSRIEDHPELQRPEEIAKAFEHLDTRREILAEELSALEASYAIALLRIAANAAR